MLALLIGTVVCWFFRDFLLELLQRPYSVGVDALKAKYPEMNPILYNPGITSPFTLALKVSAVAGAVLTSPIWLHQLWAFIVPGLLAKEKKWSLIFIGTATPLFLAGVLVGYRGSQGHHRAARLHQEPSPTCSPSLTSCRSCSGS